ncbi:MAG TPA: hypothetical protein VHX38_20150 [Pseudonocardiaceae bacterium]|jgi:hypothetical protein|nr:hypothetical protein [Pseudonocardiaceae bacterium]
MHSQQRVRHTARLLLGIASACLLVVGLPANAGPATDQALTVDLSSTTGPATGVGSGFLYGLDQDGSGPADSLLAPLNPTSGRGGGARLPGGGWIGDGMTAGSGYQARITSALDQARRLTTGSYHASYDLLVSDLFGADTTQPSNTVYPCTNGDCGNWISFIDRVVADVEAAGLTVNFDIWNEPDGAAFWGPGMNTTQYFQMWDSAVNEIRRLDPGATIVGPSLSGWQYTPLGTFLDHVKAANTVPNILNWHFSGDPMADAQTANSMLSARGISGVRLSINEYLFADNQNAGYEAWYLGQLAKAGYTNADHAIWTDCCVAGTLDSTLVPDSGGNLQPTGQWWVYRDYAQVTGQLVAVNNNGGSTDAVAAEDPSADRATVLLGDSAGNTGSVSLTVNGLSSRPWLAGPNGIAVTVQRIPDQNPLSTPITVTSEVVAGSSSSVQVPIDWQAANDAYFVTLTPATSSSVIVDGATTSGTDYFQYGANWGQTDGVSDMYDGTANWSYVPGSVAQLHFVGSQVALHAVRDVDQGQCTLSVDGATPVTVDDYAASRNASGVVWTSPALASGSHTLTITVGGKDAASSGNNIAIDRADIS